MMYFSSVSRSIVLSLRSGRGVAPRRVMDRRERERREREPAGGARRPRLSCLELFRGRLSFGDKFVFFPFVSAAASSCPPVSLRKSFFHASSSMSSSIPVSGSVLDLPILKQAQIGSLVLEKVSSRVVFFRKGPPATAAAPPLSGPLDTDKLCQAGAHHCLHPTSLLLALYSTV